MKCYLLGYAILAVYLGGTNAAGLGFWQIDVGARPLWLIGAVCSMLGLAMVLLRRRDGA